MARLYQRGMLTPARQTPNRFVLTCMLVHAWSLALVPTYAFLQLGDLRHALTLLDLFEPLFTSPGRLQGSMRLAYKTCPALELAAHSSGPALMHSRQRNASHNPCSQTDGRQTR